MNNKHVKQKNKHMKPKNKKNIFLNILLLIMILTFIYSTYNIVFWIKDDKETKALEEGLFSEVIVETEEKSESREQTIDIDFEKLKETNSDIIGWIRIENTYINYPILQGETDEYYLRKDIYKNYSIAGSIFVDSNVSPDFTDENTVIYGHNMKNGRMFADLHKICNGELGKEVFIEVYTEKETLKYKVISSYIGAPELSVIQSKFNESQKKKYIQNAINNSNIKFTEKVDTSKEILTLITCDQTSKKRVIVNAIKIEEQKNKEKQQYSDKITHDFK